MADPLANLDELDKLLNKVNMHLNCNNQKVLRDTLLKISIL